MGASLPKLTDSGLLPPGVHDCVIAEVEALFGRFQKSDRRCSLFKRLAEYAGEVARAEIRGSLVVDGSFVMAQVDEPDDIDLVLVLPKDWKIEAELRPVEYNLLSKAAVRKRFGFDVFVVRDASLEEREWLEFFANVNPKWNSSFALPVGLQKGLLRIRL